VKRCAFLTLDDPSGFVIDDELAYPPLAELGWEVEAVPWRRPGVGWGRFDAVVIRSPWDYQDDPAGFLAVLAAIERSGAPLYNGLELVRWNLDKTYLRELEAGGVATVPTVWRDRLGPGGLGRLFDAVGAGEMVVKPTVGANADGAFRLDRRAAAERAGEVETYFAARPLMAQPFVRAVVDEGEFSLFFFDGAYSHGVLKTPRAADFRVQEEHGGLIRPVEATGALLGAGEAAIRPLGPPPLYARADLVRSDDGDGFRLMELELVEPSLYLRMHPEAPGRFARALDRRVAALGG
jgi:glutathione synthase/RimK-type ligase-like ATP-grasp enzyme